MSDHRRYRDWSAAYVLGALEPGERAEFEGHLATCDECRDEVSSLAPLPGLLGHLDSLEPATAPDRIADRAAHMVRSEWIQLVASRRRWRWVAGIAAVLAVTLLVAQLLTPASDGDDLEGTVLAVESSMSTTGEITLHEWTWGTSVSLELSGLPARDRYIAWAVTDDGSWEQIGSWGPTPSGDSRVIGATSVPTDRVVSVVITTDDRDDRIAAANADA